MPNIRPLNGENFLHGDGQLTIIITINFVLVIFSLRPAHKFPSGLNFILQISAPNIYYSDDFV